jgi:hypothetical protein
MRRSAVRAVLTSAALLFAAACGGGPPEPGESAEAAQAAQAAWKLYRSRPAADTYFNFIRANSTAAGAHGRPDDAVGLEYRCRALDVMADEALRTSDASVADPVVEQVDEMERRELLATYDEILPGAKKRFLDARARASKLAH